MLVVLNVLDLAVGVGFLAYSFWLGPVSAAHAVIWVPVGALGLVHILTSILSFCVLFKPSLLECLLFCAIVDAVVGVASGTLGALLLIHWETVSVWIHEINEEHGSAGGFHAPPHYYVPKVIADHLETSHMLVAAVVFGMTAVQIMRCITFFAVRVRLSEVLGINDREDGCCSCCGGESGGYEKPDNDVLHNPGAMGTRQRQAIKRNLSSYSQASQAASRPTSYIIWDSNDVEIEVQGEPPASPAGAGDHAPPMAQAHLLDSGDGDAADYSSRSMYKPKQRAATPWDARDRRRVTQERRSRLQEKLFEHTPPPHDDSGKCIVS